MILEWVRSWCRSPTQTPEHNDENDLVTDGDASIASLPVDVMYHIATFMDDTSLYRNAYPLVCRGWASVWLSTVFWERMFHDRYRDRSTSFMMTTTTTTRMEMGRDTTWDGNDDNDGELLRTRNSDHELWWKMLCYQLHNTSHNMSQGIVRDTFALQNHARNRCITALATFDVFYSPHHLYHDPHRNDQIHHEHKEEYHHHHHHHHIQYHAQETVLCGDDQYRLQVWTRPLMNVTQSRIAEEEEDATDAMLREAEWTCRQSLAGHTDYIVDINPRFGIDGTDYHNHNHNHNHYHYHHRHHNHHHNHNEKSLIATASQDGSVGLWELSPSSLTAPLSLRGRLPFHRDWVRGTAWQGIYLASFSRDGGLVFSDVEAQRCIRSIDRGHRHAVWRATGTPPDGHPSLLVTGDAPGVLQLWDARLGEAMDTRPAHNDAINILKTVPLESYSTTIHHHNINNINNNNHNTSNLPLSSSSSSMGILSGSMDGELKLWDLRHMEHPLWHHRSSGRSVFSDVALLSRTQIPDPTLDHHHRHHPSSANNGLHIAVVSIDGSLRVIDLATGAITCIPVTPSQMMPHGQHWDPFLGPVSSMLPTTDAPVIHHPQRNHRLLLANNDTMSPRSIIGWPFYYSTPSLPSSSVSSRHQRPLILSDVPSATFQAPSTVSRIRSFQSTASRIVASVQNHAGREYVHVWSF